MTTPDKSASLDRFDLFLFNLSKINHFSARMDCWYFKSSISERLVVIKDQILAIPLAIHVLTESVIVPKLLGYILSFGNFMNGGTSRGQADGFGLDLLAVIQDVKAKDNSCTLIQYIIRTLMRFEFVHVHVPEIAPVPSVEVMVKASECNFEKLSIVLDLLSKELTMCAQQCNLLCFSGHLKTTMDDALFTTKVALELQTEKLICVQAEFENYVAYFNDEKRYTPTEFFDVWRIFFVNFSITWKVFLSSLSIVYISLIVLLSLIPLYILVQFVCRDIFSTTSFHDHIFFFILLLTN